MRYYFAPMEGLTDSITAGSITSISPVWTGTICPSSPPPSTAS